MKTIPVPEVLQNVEIHAVLFFGVIPELGVMPIATTNGPDGEIDPRVYQMLMRIKKHIEVDAAFDGSTVVDIGRDNV